MKKFLVFLSLFFIILGVSISQNNHPTAAAGAAPTAAPASCYSVLGFVPWNCNVNLDTSAFKDENTLKTTIWTIVANVATDLTVAASYLVLIFVIYGGYFYICANGDSGKVATGKKILSQAFIGLAIVMSASVIMSTIRTVLATDFNAHCISISDTSTTQSVQDGGCAGSADPNSIVTSLIQWVISVAGFVSVIFVVFGGIAITTSSGDPTKVQKARNTIIYALIGLALVALAEIITAFVSNLIREANNNAYLPPTSIIAKSPNYSSQFINRKDIYDAINH